MAIWRYGAPWSRGARVNRIADRLNHDPSDRVATRRLARYLNSGRDVLRREGAWVLSELVEPSGANWSLVQMHLFDVEPDVRRWCVLAVHMRGKDATGAELQRAWRVAEGLKLEDDLPEQGTRHWNDVAAELLRDTPESARPHRAPTAQDLRAELRRVSQHDLKLMNGAFLWTTENVYLNDDRDQRLLAHTGIRREQSEQIWEGLLRFERRTPQPDDGSATIGEVVDIVVRGGNLQWRSDALDLIRNSLETLDALVTDGDLAVLHDATRSDLRRLLALVSIDT